MLLIIMETGDEKEDDMSFSVADLDGEVSSRDGNGAFIVGQYLQGGNQRLGKALYWRQPQFEYLGKGL